VNTYTYGLYTNVDGNKDANSLDDAITLGKDLSQKTGNALVVVWNSDARVVRLLSGADEFVPTNIKMARR
jgi:hypothetical protein